MLDSIEQLEQEVEQFRKSILASGELIKSLDAVVSSCKAQRDSMNQAKEELIAKMEQNVADVRSDAEDQLQSLGEIEKAALASFTKKGNELLAEMKAISGDTARQNEVVLQGFRDASGLQAETIKTISANQKEQFQKQMEQVVHRISDAQKDYLRSIEGAQTAVGNSSNEAVQKISSTLQEYISGLKDAEAALTEQREEAGRQHDELLKKLEEKLGSILTKLDETQTSIQGEKADLTQKYEDFLKCLNDTNIVRMLQIVQDMKSLVSIKLLLIMGGVAVSVVLSILALVLR